ncbi:MAG TPA: methyl-accepting chemotaxis protein, partial [Sphingomonas sp.]|nr:methyl-accepting chemotaxis protein [Sphingomonas sp.]
MTAFLNKMSISTKITALLMSIGAVALFLALSGSHGLASAATKVAALIDVKMSPTIEIVRANRALNTMSWRAYQVMTHDGSSRAARFAADDEQASFESAMEKLQSVKQADPSTATEVDLVTRFTQQIHGYYRQAIELGLQNRDEEAMVFVKRGDALADKVGASLIPFNNARIASAKVASKDLANAAHSTVTMLLSIAVASVVGGLVLAMILTRKTITAPLKSLAAQMGTIAAGDYAKPVEGIDRGDEVGTMAKAVRVFRENGIAKQAADTAKARADAEQKVVVDTVSHHLADLSNGDLTASIKEDFPADYVALKTNFNDALDKLRELIGAVGESAASIRTGSGEIAQASEDLAR